MAPMPRVLVVFTVLWLGAMLVLASPRNTGDASEYVGMAINLARLDPPALSDADIRALPDRASRHAGFELETRRIPELRGRDGRFDMPHMWLYALLAVPGIWAAQVVGAPPAWGFVGLNLALVAGVLAVAVRRGAGAWALALVASPVVWWLDKPLADLFIASSLGLAVLWWPRHGPLSLAVLGLAAAQNPALAAPCVVFAACAVAEDVGRLRDWRWQAGAVIGAALAAMAPAYYLWRLARLSPLTGWTTAAWPTWTSLLFPLADVNMGLLPRVPPLAALVGLALLRRDAWRTPAATPAALSALALLVVVSQQPNMNQGGNPDLSRYAVWLLPLALPWLLHADHSPRRATHVLGVVLLVACAAWTAAAFLPTRPESYRYPTPLASWVWSRHPSWASPRPEAFAERTSHREPAIVPSATPGCEKVLLFEGTWPASCPPQYAEVPTTCLARGAFCYADAYGWGMHTVRYVGVQPGYQPVVSDRTWRAGDPDASWVGGVVAGLRSGEPPPTHASVRGVWDVAWTQVWWNEDGRMVIYARNASPGARLALRHANRASIVVRTPGSVVATTQLDPADAPTIVTLPAGPHVVVEVR